MSPSTDTVKVRSITERVGSGDDARTVTANFGEPVPDGISADRMRELRDLGAIASRGDDAPDPADVPAVTRDRSALDAVGTGVNPDGGAKGVTGPGDSSSTSTRSEPTAELPDDAPDAADADVAELAGYIDSANDGSGLNAAQTVALAEGDPDLAGKVLEAERTAHGDDARVTVERPLSKLAARADTSGGDTPPAEPPPEPPPAV